MISIAQALKWATTELSQSSSAQLDAELLVCFVLAKDRTYLFTYPEQTLNDSQWQQFQDIVQARKDQVPVAYLLGEKEFWSLNFYVDSHVLIPRPETETLVELALACPLAVDATVADLGTGSGAIACALAHSQPDWTVLACDKSEKALAVAGRNVQRHQLSNVQLLQGDWLSGFTEHSLDMIVSNPPYLDPIDPHLRESIQHEPDLALVAQNRGLACLETIIRQAPTYLRSGGYLLLEHGFSQGPEVRDLMSKDFIEVASHNDLQGQPRVTSGKLANT